LNAEVIALDSATLYRGMDIATAKPTVVECAGIPHHLIDILDPWQSASVADYRGWAEIALQRILARGKRALFVGGTPLYLKVLLRGLFEGPAADRALRAELEAEAVAAGEVALHARLAAVDPITAARLPVGDRRRIVRALEVFALSGRPISQLQAEHERPAPPNVAVIALDLPRPALHCRINERVERFFAAGLVDEVKSLRTGPEPMSDVAAQAIGYAEVIAMLDNHEPVGRTIERIQVRTRQFAKRQATWFRGLQEVRTMTVAPATPPDEIAEQLIPLIEYVTNLNGF
jgi:tRNA dimethylallyltransferase